MYRERRVWCPYSKYSTHECTLLVRTQVAHVAVTGQWAEAELEAYLQG